MLSLYVLLIACGLIALFSHSGCRPFDPENRKTVFREWLYGLGLTVWSGIAVLCEVGGAGSYAYPQLCVAYALALSVTIFLLFWQPSKLRTVGC